MVWKRPWWVSGCGYTDFIFGAGDNLIIILCPSDDWCRFSQNTTPQLNTIPHSGQHTVFFSNHSRCFKILSHYYTSIWNKLQREWGQHFKILTLKDSPTTAHSWGILNLKYPNAVTQYCAQRVMLRIKHRATKMYSSMRTHTDTHTHTHTHTHRHILNLSIWWGERLTSSWLLHLHSQCLWNPFNRRLGVPQNTCECFWAEENLFSNRNWMLILQSCSFLPTNWGQSAQILYM